MTEQNSGMPTIPSTSEAMLIPLLSEQTSRGRDPLHRVNSMQPGLATLLAEIGLMAQQCGH